VKDNEVFVQDMESVMEFLKKLRSHFKTRGYPQSKLSDIDGLFRYVRFEHKKLTEGNRK
jgi:hypothetical protein